jgi:hypothetical protein
MLYIYSAYYVTHKPFTPEQLISILFIAYRIFIAIFISALAGGVGIYARVDKLDLPPLSIACLATALGLGIISFYVFVWGVLLGVNTSILILPLVTLFILRKSVLRWIMFWGDAKNLWVESKWLGKSILITSSIILFCGLMLSLAPPLGFDTLTYHFSIPQTFIHIKEISFLPNLMFWGMPSLNEMLYMLSAIMGGMEAASVLSFALGILLLAGLAGFTKKILGANVACVAVAGLLCTGVTTIFPGSGYVEWSSMLFGLAMLLSLMAWIGGNDNYPLIFAGIFAGFALGTKYTSGVILIAGLLVILLMSKPLFAKKTIMNLLIFGLFAVLMILPWLARNVITTGNPFYPIVFPTQMMDSIRLGFFNVPPVNQDWSRFIILPFQATILGIDGREGYSAAIGPILLTFSPLALIFLKSLDDEKRKITIIGTIIIFTGFLIWALLSQFSLLLIQSRLYMGIFPAWAILAAIGFDQLDKLQVSKIRFSNIGSVFITLSMIFAAYTSVYTIVSTNPISVVLGYESNEDYIKHNLGGYYDATSSIKHLPKDSKVLMLWETRGYYCEPICDSDEIIDRWFHDWRVTGEIDALIVKWRQQGYTHILLNLKGMEFIRQYDRAAPFVQSDWAALEELMKRLTIVEKFGESYVLYSLK